MKHNENAAYYFVDRHLGTPIESKPAFIEAFGQGRQMTYEELAHRSSLMADLFATHGIRREDRVAMLVLDQLEFPVIFWGSLKCGAIPVAINTMLPPDAYVAILQDSRARALFVSSEIVPAIEPIIDRLTHLEKIFVIGNDSGQYINFDAELDQCLPSETLEAVADECAFWLYSSGSTGQPKGVRHAHGNLRFTADAYGAQILNIEADDVVFSAAKLFFAYGLGNSMTFPMSVGATALLYNGRPTPDSVVNVLNTRKPSIFYAVPTLYAALNSQLDSGKFNLDANLRRCISAGEALPEEVGKSWERLSSCEILDGVGSTEMLHIFLSNRSGSVAYGTSGTAVPGYKFRLVDESGASAPPGEVGELLVDGDSSALDYWNQRAKSRSTFEGRWTRTGDKYTCRDDGRFVYCGRTDDMFKVSGIWVSPFEVEQSLASHSSVLEAAVVSACDSEGLEKPKAFVVLKDGADSRGIRNALIEHVKAQIGNWKYPRWIEIVDDLPKTSTGKIQRFKLRE